MATLEAKSTRIEWLDVAKGFGILIVVLGHSGTPWINPYISWIQMPLFFFLGGISFKNARDKNQHNVVWTVRKIIQYAIPYILFAIGTYIAFRMINPAVLPPKRAIVFGGAPLKGIYGVFWFIPVYLGTVLVFNIISQLKSRTAQIAIVMALFCVGHTFAVMAEETRVIFLNLDVIPISLLYFASGYYLKDQITKRINNITTLACIALVFTVVMMQRYGIVNLNMDMKNKLYTHLFFDAVVPLACIFAFLGIVMTIYKGFSFMKYPGVASLYIMYLHIPLNVAIKMIFDIQYNQIVFILIGIIVPTIFYYQVLLPLKMLRTSAFDRIFRSRNPQPTLPT